MLQWPEGFRADLIKLPPAAAAAPAGSVQPEHFCSNRDSRPEPALNKTGKHAISPGFVFGVWCGLHDDIVQPQHARPEVCAAARSKCASQQRASRYPGTVHVDLAGVAPRLFPVS